MTPEAFDESRQRIEAFMEEHKQALQVESLGLIGRLATMGDHEAQSFVASLCALATSQPKFIRTSISSDVRREVWRRDEGKCVKCGSRERLEYDHIIPISIGGSNTARNIELLCEACNRIKSSAIQ